MNFPLIEPLESRIAPASLSILQPVDSPKNEGSSGGTTSYVFKFVLDAPVTGDVTFLASTLNGTAEAGSDFTGITDQLITILEGQTEATLMVSVTHDTVIEGDETFSVVINPASITGGAVVNAASAAATIKNDDREVSIISEVSKVEEDAGSSDMVFTLTLSSASTEAVEVTYSTAHVTTDGSDYTTATDQKVTFAPGQTTAQIRVPISGDTTGEADETFLVNLTAVTNGTLKAGEVSAEGTIVNDPSISIADTSLVEGNDPDVPTNMTFTVTLEEGFIYPVTVHYATQNGTAKIGDDFGTSSTQVSGDLTFNMGETTKQILIPIEGDTLAEGEETFSVVLSDAKQNGVAVSAITDATGSGKILDNDAQVFINDVTIVEGDDGQQTALFTVSLNTALSGPVSVKYKTVLVGGEANSDPAYLDFVEIEDTVDSPAPTLTFTAGQTTKTIAVSILGDLHYEATDETFEVLLFGASGVQIADATGVGTIVNTSPLDPQQTITVADGTLVEGDSGTANMTFDVTLNGGPAATDTVITFTVVNGTAKGGTDYSVPVSLTVTIPAGDTSAQISIPIIGDETDENDETFTVVLTDAGTVPIETAVATGAITDDDAAPTASINSVSVVEGSPAIFTVTLSEVSGKDVTIKWLTANGTAVAGDYTAVTTEQTLVIPAGQTTGTISVATTNDSGQEDDETFEVELQPTSTVSFTTDTGTATIGANDPPTISVSNQTIVEGNAGTTQMIFTVNLSGASTQPITVSYSTSNGTATILAGDFAAASGVVTFAPGDTSEQVIVNINGDVAGEVDEHFFLSLSSPVNAVLGTSSVQGTILNDDTSYKLVRLSDNLSGPLSITEEGSPVLQQYAEFKVVRDGITADIAGSINYSTALDDAAGPTQALAGVDFTTTSGTINFASGETTSTDTIRVPIIQDDLFELNERFKVKLSNATNGVISPTAGESVVTIQNNDTLPTITIEDASIAEGNSLVTVTNLKFKVKLSGPAAGPVTVDYATSDLVALAGTDYVGKTGTVTFAAGETEKEITIEIKGDAFAEEHDTFLVTLSNAELELPSATTTELTIDDSEATGTILNDDRYLTINSASVTEGDAGTKNLVFTVTLAGAIVEAEDGEEPNTVTVNYSTLDGSGATAAKATGAMPDYIASSSTLTFTEGGATTQTITIAIVGDVWKESSETFTTRLSGAQGATVITADGTGTILDNNDATLGLAVSDVQVVEGNSGTRNATFIFELSDSMVGQEITLHAKTRPGSATEVSTSSNSADYVGIDEDRTFTPTVGAPKSFSISIAINSDTKFEASESFFLDVTNLSENVASATASGGVTTARGLIYNDDIHVISTKEFVYVDQDGDLVNVKISKGSLTSGSGVITSRVTLTPTGSLGGSVLTSLILSSENFSGSEYSGANITITATPQLLGGGETIGDGFANVHEIKTGIRSDADTFIRGIGLGTVKIDGDLGRIEGGNHIAPNGVKRLEVASFGKSNSSNASVILGPIGTLIVHGDMTGSLTMLGGIFGKIGTLNIKGSLVGGSTANSGQIQFEGSIGTATIGSIIGGSGSGSGSLFGANNYTTFINKVTVTNGVTGGSGSNSGIIDVSALGPVTLGELIGGTGNASGRVSTDFGIQSVTINGDIVGGSNSATGYIQAGFSMGKVLVKGDIVGGSGSSSGAIDAALFTSTLTVEGDILGGEGDSSGAIGFISYAGGLYNSSVSKISLGKLVNGLPVGGNIVGGTGQNSGSIQLQGNVGSLTVMGDIVYGEDDQIAADGAGGIFVEGKLSKGVVEGSIIGGSSEAGSTLEDSGYIQANDIGSLIVKGDVIGGENLGDGIASSGAIRSNGSIASLVINGNLKGTDTNNAIISALNSIKKLQVGGDVEFAEILAGYDKGGTISSPRANAINPDAQIGTIQINGSFRASSIVAGIAAGDDDKFGTLDDEVISGEDITDSVRVISKIAKVIIGSVGVAPVNPADASFGIVAEHVVSVQIGGITQPLISGPYNDGISQLGVGSKIYLAEVAPILT